MDAVNLLEFDILKVIHRLVGMILEN